MRQYISTNPMNKILDLGVEELRRSPIKSAYISSLPPRRSYLHGPSVEFFFPSGGLAIRGEIIQVGPKYESFHLALSDTLGLEYWKKELGDPIGSSVAQATDLSAGWRAEGLEAFLSGPREIRLYTRSTSEPTRGKLDGIEIIAQQTPQQRIILIASDDDPGDVIVITPSGEYEHAVAKLMALD